MGGLGNVAVAARHYECRPLPNLFLHLTANHEEITKESRKNHEKQSNVHALFTS